jgi:hypothetical protein
MSKVRAIVVIVIALLAIGQIVRNAFVLAYASDAPQKAVIAWPSNPDVLFKAALEDIASAAAAGRPAPKTKIDAIYAAASGAPLAPEPFLVRGVEAQLAGDQSLAEQAFKAALRRSPRSRAAHYFLADHYLRTNQADAGLAELARLTRLVPNGIAAVAPYYASYAKAPGGAPRVKAMLRAHPEFGPDVLSALATDAANADLVLYLARGRGDTSGEPPAWHGKLVESLVAAGQYPKARTVWATLSGQQAAAEQGLFDSQFSGNKAPPPFNWTLLSTASGLAEGEGQGRLHIIYYGRDNATLASQTLTLKPGRYRLGFEVEGGSQSLSSLVWKLRCLPSKKSLASLGLASGRRVSGDFAVPADCPAQLLELSGVAPEFPQTVDVTVRGLALSKVAS